MRMEASCRDSKADGMGKRREVTLWFYSGGGRFFCFSFGSFAHFRNSLLGTSDSYNFFLSPSNGAGFSPSNSAAVMTLFPAFAATSLMGSRNLDHIGSRNR